ncbi:MAG: cyclic nucleotide-binding domain-containing protein [Caldilineaceae bacterium]|nr:cyclic nucleotide-binding domain-containing protein [Caldilineaceae bacterium]
MRFLRGVDLFHEVPDDVLATVARAANEIRFAPGDRIITQGDPGDSLFVIVDGAVDVLIESKGRVADHGARNVLGEMGVLTNRPRSATCVATTETSTLQISHDAFMELLGETPRLALGVIGVLARRLDATSHQVALHSTRPV